MKIPFLSLLSILSLISIHSTAAMTCPDLLNQNLSPIEERELSSLRSMVAQGLESYAIDILERKMEVDDITHAQALLLASIYVKQSNPSKELSVRLYIIQALRHADLLAHRNLIYATSRYVEQNPDESEKLTAIIKTLRPNYENEREFFTTALKTLLKNKLFAEARPFAQRAYELSEEDEQKVSVLKKRWYIANELRLFEEVYEIDLLLDQLAPNKPYTLYSLALYNFKKLNDYDEALNLVRRVYSKNPKKFTKRKAYVLEAQILMRLNRFADAFSRISTGYMEFPDDQVIKRHYDRLKDNL